MFCKNLYILILGMLSCYFDSAAQENIARGKIYTMSRPSKYPHTEDPGDVTQLTDGAYAQGNRMFWVRKDAVGWGLSTEDPIVTVTIDLGSIQPISGVTWNTAAGSSGVRWPMHLLVFVSNDNRNWTYVADLAKGTGGQILSDDQYREFKYFLTDLQTHGRWVRIVVSQDTYAFCDEIEILKGRNELLSLPAGQIAIQNTEAEAKRIAAFASMQHRFHEDANILSKRLEGMDGKVKYDALKKIEKLKEEFQKLPIGTAENLIAVLPYHSLLKQLYALNSICLEEKGYRHPFLWKSGKWDNISIISLPEYPSFAASHIEMMKNESRSGAFNICNPYQYEVSFDIAENNFPNMTGLELFEVLFTDTFQRIPVASALVPLKKNSFGVYTVNIPAGCSKQIWFTFNRPKLPSGIYSGALKIKYPAGELQHEVCLRLAEVGFPEYPSLHVGGWDYTDGKGDRFGTPKNRDATIHFLKSIFVDSPWASRTVMPQRGKFDAAGDLFNATELDFTEWDAWVTRWSGARRYYIYMAAGKQFYGEPVGTTRFQKMVSSYYKAWREHLKKNKIRPEQVILHPVDEPKTKDAVNLAVKWAEAIKAADTGMLLFSNPSYFPGEFGNQELYKVFDILCPHTPNFFHFKLGKKYQQSYRKWKNPSQELCFYSCNGPSRLLDPVMYYRLQMWLTYYFNGTGSFYWAFGDAGKIGNSWLAYQQKRLDFSPYFVSEDSVIPSKQSVAILEGIQDFEYLKILSDLLEKEKKNGENMNEYQERMHQIVKSVIQTRENSSERWTEVSAEEREMVDKARIDILHLIETVLMRNQKEK